MRTITINMNSISYTQFNAIGRLCSWAVESYDQVTITTDGKCGDLVAYYKNSVTGGQFVMGAVWREGEYSFHS
jgi:hypothetical protein